MFRITVLVLMFLNPIAEMEAQKIRVCRKIRQPPAITTTTTTDTTTTTTTTTATTTTATTTTPTTTTVELCDTSSENDCVLHRACPDQLELPGVCGAELQACCGPTTGNKGFKIYQYPSTYYGAKEGCEEQLRIPAMFKTSRHTIDFAQFVMTQTPDEEFWIGIKADGPMKWKYVDGTPVPGGMLTGFFATTLSWQDNDETNTADNKNCMVAISKTHFVTIEDRDCSEMKKAICQEITFTR